MQAKLQADAFSSDDTTSNVMQDGRKISQQDSGGICYNMPLIIFTASVPNIILCVYNITLLCTYKSLILKTEDDTQAEQQQFFRGAKQKQSILHGRQAEKVANALKKAEKAKQEREKRSREVSCSIYPQ